MDLLAYYDSDSCASNSHNDCDCDCGENRMGQQPLDAILAVSAESPPESHSTVIPSQTLGCVTIIASGPDDTRLNESVTGLFTRTVPHRVGNWAGHVFLDVTSTLRNPSDPDDQIGAFAERCRRVLQDFEQSGVLVAPHPTASFHVSLARPFYVHIACIDSFVRQLRIRLESRIADAFRGENNRTALIPIVSSKPVVLVNEEKTRSFFAWSVVSNHILRELVKVVDEVMDLYRLSHYYDPPTFHVSVASFPGDLSMIRERLEDTLRLDSGCDRTRPGILYHRVASVHCTFGTTKAFQIPLD
jgi:hypothetical protein